MCSEVMGACRFTFLGVSLEIMKTFEKFVFGLKNLQVLSHKSCDVTPARPHVMKKSFQWQISIFLARLTDEMFGNITSRLQKRLRKILTPCCALWKQRRWNMPLWSHGANSLRGDIRPILWISDTTPIWTRSAHKCNRLRFNWDLFGEKMFGRVSMMSWRRSISRLPFFSVLFMPLATLRSSKTRNF